MFTKDTHKNVLNIFKQVYLKIRIIDPKQLSNYVFIEPFEPFKNLNYNIVIFKTKYKTIFYN